MVSGTSFCVIRRNIPSGRPPVHRQAARRAHRAHARDLFEPVDQVGKEDRLTGLGLGIVHPRKRDVHRDDPVHAEPGIHFEHFHQAAPEQSRSDHEHQSDRDLRRHDDPANALAALRTRACPRPPSPRPLRRSPEVARKAVNAPRPAATAVERRNANTSTGRLIEMPSSRGRFAGASATSPATPPSAPRTPRPPPTSESRNASARNWRISRPRAAPSALRTASSRSLAPTPVPAAGSPRSRTPPAAEIPPRRAGPEASRAPCP